MNLKFIVTVLITLIAISEMSLPCKGWCYTCMLITIYTLAEAKFDSLSQTKTVLSNSRGQLPTKVTLEGGGNSGRGEFEDVSDWQPGCGLPSSKYKNAMTTGELDRMMGVSGGECSSHHAFPWMARIVG